MTGEWEKSWFDGDKLPFVRKEKQNADGGATDTDEEVSVHLEPDSFSQFCGLIIIPKKERKKTLTA